MKWILLVLIATNLGLGGYQYWVSTQEQGSSVVDLEVKFDNLSLSSSQVLRLEKSGSARVVVEVIEKPTENKCIRISGLNKKESLTIVESRLRALEVNAVNKNLKELIKTDYQLLLGPFDNLAIARSELEKVKGLGLESYVITSGTNANTLSLGVFSSGDNASRRRAELAELKLSASIYKKEHFTETNILHIDEVSSALIAEETLDSLLDDFEGSKYDRIPCN